MSTGKVLLGILAGAAAGAIAGILLAPDKGSETRRKMAEKADDYAEGLKEKFADVVDHIDDTIKHLKKEAAELAGKVKKQAADAETTMHT